MMKLKKHYDSKSEFISDFIQLCRELQEQHKKEMAKMPYFLCKFVGIKTEYWRFCFYIDSESVSTDAVLYKLKPNSSPPECVEIQYPKTQWGERYLIRWDADLREFLKREICKAEAQPKPGIMMTYGGYDNGSV